MIRGVLKFLFQVGLVVLFTYITMLGFSFIGANDDLVYLLTPWIGFTYLVVLFVLRFSD